MVVVNYVILENYLISGVLQVADNGCVGGVGIVQRRDVVASGEFALSECRDGTLQAIVVGRT